MNWLRRHGVGRRGAIALLVAVMFGLGLAPVAAGAAVPAAGVVVTKRCADAPEPSKPNTGVPGAVYPRPATASAGDPFTDPEVAFSSVYGYGYHWRIYDTGCLPGSKAGPGIDTDLSNFGLGLGSSIVGLTHSSLSLVVSPTWLAPLDAVVEQATSLVVGQTWSRWVTPAILIVGVMLLVYAGRADISTVVTNLGWLVFAFVLVTYTINYPVEAARSVDALLSESVSATAGGGTALEGLDRQFDAINRSLLYAVWLEGTLGSTTSAVAVEHGPALFAASHLTWDETATVEADPGAGKAIIEAKKNAWVEAAAEVEAVDSGAYRQLTGQNSRVSNGFTAFLQTALTMPFLVVAGVMVLLAYGALRVAIPLIPALGLLAMVEFSRSWFTSAAARLGKFLVMGPFFWVGALINIAITSGVWRSELAYVLKMLLSLAVPVLLAAFLRPGGMGTLARGLAMRRMLKRAGGGGSGGGEDKKDDEDKPADDSDQAPASNGNAEAPKGNGGADRPVASAPTRQLPAAPEPPTPAARTAPVANPHRPAPTSAEADTAGGRGPEEPAYWSEPDPDAWQPAHAPGSDGYRLEPVAAIEDEDSHPASADLQAPDPSPVADAELSAPAASPPFEQDTAAGPGQDTGAQENDQEGQRIWTPPVSSEELSAPAAAPAAGGS